jgi:hypothetical protein
MSRKQRPLSTSENAIEIDETTDGKTDSVENGNEGAKAKGKNKVKSAAYSAAAK